MLVEQQHVELQPVEQQLLVPPVHFVVVTLANWREPVVADAVVVPVTVGLSQSVSHLAAELASGG